jgi:hypothetical protein
MAGLNGEGFRWLDGLPIDRIDAAQPSGRGAGELDCDEIGASCQKAQALAKGNPALALEGLGYQRMIIGVVDFQPGGGRSRED